MLEPKDLDFTGRRVLITGAASGIGAAMASAFAAHGASLVLADLNGDGLEHVAEDLGGEVAWHRYDQGDLKSIAGLAEAAGDVDVLMNNAGIGSIGPLIETEPETIRRVVEVNLVGPMVLARHIAPAMIARGRGVIVNTASQLAFSGGLGRVAYSAAKAGIVQFTRTAAAEWAPHGVRVVALAPGRTLTPMTADRLATAEQRRAGLEGIPLGRFGEAEEMARFGVFLASDAAAYMVGTTLIADGGYVIA